MRKHKLALAAIVSILGLGLLVMSYPWGIHVGVQWPPPSSTSTQDGWLAEVFTGTGLVYGAVHIHRGVAIPPQNFRYLGPLWWQGFGGDVPDWRTIRSSSLSFDWRNDSYRRGSSGSVRATKATAPAWVFMPLCFIAPVLWLRRRRRERGRGFPVVAGAEASAE